MESITMINAEKAVNSGLTAKTSSTIAATDLVQLFANDGTPNGKISKADLMDAVKASLPALLSDQTTTADNVLTLASNALGKSTVANLASVLGGTTTAITDWDSINFNGMVSSGSSANNAPDTSGYFTGFQFLNSRHLHTYQIATRSSDLTVYIRVKTSLNANWGVWKKIESSI